MSKRFYYDEFLEEIYDEQIGDYPSNQSICGILNQQSERIAELEEQLKNAIVPKFKVGQEIWEITPLMSWKIKRIEWHKFNGGAGDVVVEIYRLGHDGTDDYNCCIMPVDSDRFFATKEEAQAKLQQMKGNDYE